MRSQRLPRLTVIVLSLCVTLAIVASACSIEESMPIPDCERGDSAMIAAQSVPTAEMVLCFTALPAGWETDTIRINESGSVFRFDSDRAGDSAAVLHFSESCDHGEAIEMQSDLEGTQRFDFIDRVEPGFRAERYYEFRGGCIWWKFDFDDGAPAALSVEIGNTLALLTRTEFSDRIREFFVDEDF